MRKLWPILSLLAIAGCHYHGEYPNARNPDCEPAYTYREERIDPVAPQAYDTGEQWESQTYNHEPVTVYERPAATYDPQPPMVYEERVYQPVIIEGGAVYSNPYYYDNDGPYYHGRYNRDHDNDRDLRNGNHDRDIRRDNRDVRRDDSQSGDRVRNRDQQKKLKDAVEAQDGRRREREQAVERPAKMPVRMEKNKSDDQQQVDRDRKRSSSDDADQTVEAKKSQPKAQPKNSDPQRPMGKSSRSSRPSADSDSSDSSRVRRR